MEPGSGCFSFRSAADAITQYVVGYDNHYRPRHHNDDRAALFSAQSFGSAKQVAAYLGLISRLNESGAFKIRVKQYLASVCASTHNCHIKAQGERLIRTGKDAGSVCSYKKTSKDLFWGIKTKQSIRFKRVDLGS